MTPRVNMPQFTLVSIQIGQPTDYGSPDAADPHDRPWRSGIFKTPVSGPVWAGQTNLRGDGQADRAHHGGIDKAVLAYCADHYPYWRRALGIADMPFGSFGENLSVAHLDEESVCIGDVWRCGEVRFQVSQPRQPCWKLSRRWRIDDLARQVIASGKSGWYLRVLEEGIIEAGRKLLLLERPHPQWTVQRVAEAFHHRRDDLAAAAALAQLPELARSWREVFLARLGESAT